MSDTWPWEPDEDDGTGLTIRPLYELPDTPAPGPDPWRNMFGKPRPPGPEPSDAEKALAASYERYAGQLAEIDALRAGRPAI